MVPPTGPKKMAKKLATKPPGNERKGVKALFKKSRKALAPKKYPEGWTDDQWHQDCLRRKLSMVERKGRRWRSRRRRRWWRTRSSTLWPRVSRPSM
jgi:hypothetical protein